MNIPYLFILDIDSIDELLNVCCLRVEADLELFYLLLCCANLPVIPSFLNPVKQKICQRVSLVLIHQQAILW